MLKQLLSGTMEKVSMETVIRCKEFAPDYHGDHSIPYWNRALKKEESFSVQTISNRMHFTPLAWKLEEKLVTLVAKNFDILEMMRKSYGHADSFQQLKIRRFTLVLETLVNCLR